MMHQNKPDKQQFAPGTEDLPYTITSNQLLAGFTDSERDNLTIKNVQALINTDQQTGTLIETTNGWSFQPEPNFSGQVTISYEIVMDGFSASKNTIEITAVNDAPLFKGKD